MGCPGGAGTHPRHPSAAGDGGVRTPRHGFRRFLTPRLLPICCPFAGNDNISTKADTQCTEAEVLVVTLLLYDKVQHGFRLNDWATVVLAESGAFVAGELWSLAGEPLAKALKELESWLPGLKPSRVARVRTAATLYDGAGRVAASYTQASVN